MMKLKKALVFLAVLSMAAMTHAGLYVVGELQDEQGDPGDWDPANSSLLMTDTGGGIFTRSVSNLLDGTRYKFKVLDDLGTPPPAWGDPEVVNVDTMAYGDADGVALITVNTNLSNGNGGAVTWIDSDNAPLQVVGNFMDEAGGAGDWNPTDPTFAMTPHGSGYYSIDLVISTPGSYEFKATDGTGWDFQVGADGFGNNAAVHYFSTTSPNEAITMYIDTANQVVGVIPEPATMGLISVFGIGLLAARRLFKLN